MFNLKCQVKLGIFYCNQKTKHIFAENCFLSNLTISNFYDIIKI